MRRVLAAEIPGEIMRGRPNAIWKDACRRDMRIVELRDDDDVTNRKTKENKPLPWITGESRRQEEV